MAAVSLQLDQRQPGTGPEMLRRSCNELVGMMFGQLLREARQSSLARGLTDSSAYRVFRGQLDDVLIQSAARGDGGTGVFSAVSEGLYRQLVGHVAQPSPAGVAQPPSAVQAAGMDVKG